MTRIRVHAVLAAVAVLALAAPGPSPSIPEPDSAARSATIVGPSTQERAARSAERPPLAAPSSDGTPLEPTDSTERLAALREREGTADTETTLGSAEQVDLTTTEEGYELALGSAEAGDGPTVRFTVEVEPATDVGLAEVVAAVDDALFDPRSWINDAHLVRTDDTEAADVRILLGTPDTVDRLCGDAGMDTGGRYSCWTGRVAALNAWRYEHGAPDFDDLVSYRRYLINHEFGHALGHGHLDCPEPDAPAPVMMQQSISTGACSANGWPYPDER